MSAKRSIMMKYRRVIGRVERNLHVVMHALLEIMKTSGYHTGDYAIK